MKTLLLISYLILSFKAVAEVEIMKSGWHHIEPLLEEIQNTVDSANDTGENGKACNDEPKPEDRFHLSYISDKPKTESWRENYQLPKLLDDKLMEYKDVCEDAKKENAKQGVKKEYALVIHKGHLCDFGHGACISALRTASEKCNHFIQDNFQTYHVRGFVGRNKTPGSDRSREIYGATEPSLIVIRLSDCQPVPTKAAQEQMQKDKKLTIDKAMSWGYNQTLPSEGADSQGVLKFKSEDPAVRMQAMRDNLIDNIPELQKLKDKRVHCIGPDNKPSIPVLNPSKKEEDSIPYGDVKIRPYFAIRKLADEQLVTQTSYKF